MTPLRDWLRQHILTESHQALNDALAHETIFSERLRVTILAGLFGLIEVTALMVCGLFPYLSLLVFRGRLPIFTVSLIVGVALGYELRCSHS